MQKPQAILFDLDGTLLDSVVHFTAILNELLIDAQKPAVSMDQVRYWVSGGVIAMIQGAFGDDLSLQDQLDLKQHFLRLYDEQLSTVTPYCFQHVLHVLTELTAQGIALGLVTNKHQRFAEKLLDQTDFKSLLTCMVFGDTLAVSKPSPEPLYLACQRLEVVPPQTWFVGDSLVDMQAAKAAGCVAVLARYGYVDHDWQNWPNHAVLQQLVDLLALY